MAILGGVGVMVLAGVFISAPSSAQGVQEDAAARVEERLAMLEKAVLRDPYKPQETVLSRLERIERELLERQRTAEKADRGDQRSLAELHKMLENTRKQGDDLARRVKALESAKTADPLDPRELRELRRELDRATTQLNDLANRVRSLETRR
jgi:hypothetical protein